MTLSFFRIVLFCFIQIYAIETLYRAETFKEERKQIYFLQQKY